jgi:glycosyltransferase involved in cell wall biosynthesis
LNSINIQEYQDKIEIVVVNDGSTDKTKEIIEKKFPKIKLLNFDKGHSAAYARNRGAEIAKGEYLIFLDADQILEENFVKKNLENIKKNPDGAYFFVKSYKPKTIFQKAWAAYREFSICGGLIIRSEVFKKIKYNEGLFYIEDDELFTKLEEDGYKLKIAQIFVYHIDPKTFNDFFRQRKWQGRGLALKVFKLNRYIDLRYFISCLVLPFLLISIYVVPIYLVLYWTYFSIKSKQIINSFWWVITDFIGRFIALYFFIVYSLKLLIKK